VSYALVDSIVLFFSTFMFFMFVNWRLAFALVSVTPFILFISHKFIKRIRPRFALLRQKLTDLGNAVTENIAGNRVVKAFAREEHEKERFEKFNDEFRSVSCENALISARYQPFLESLSQLLVIITLLIGGYFLIREWMTAGEFMAFSSLTWALSVPLRMLGPLLADLERYTAAGIMIREVVEAEPGIADTRAAVPLTERPQGRIEFRNVNFAINENIILSDINFTVKEGSVLGILGSTGAGKTALVNLLARFYEPSSGAIFIDGCDIKEYTISSLRRHIGIAMQEVFLFSDSVKANISYGNVCMSCDDIQLRAAQADADSFILAMPNGYDTLIGERGAGLSGGQKQRIALARALSVRPSILILDDTTSSVDSETEKYIQAQLGSLDFTCTKIIIAQRIFSFRDADLIIVMDKGQIAERGTHNELLANNGLYTQLVSTE
jgi:ATP-binding cassette subfamily B protein